MGNTARGTWKQAEGRIAKFFGSERTPLSGGNSKHTRSDSLHPDIFIETKYRAVHAVRTLYDETKKLAKLEGKVPMVCLVDKNRPGWLIVVHSDDWDAARQFPGGGNVGAKD